MEIFNKLKNIMARKELPKLLARLKNLEKEISKPKKSKIDLTSSQNSDFIKEFEKALKVIENEHEKINQVLKRLDQLKEEDEYINEVLTAFNETVQRREQITKQKNEETKRRQIGSEITMEDQRITINTKTSDRPIPEEDNSIRHELLSHLKEHAKLKKAFLKSVKELK